MGSNIESKSGTDTTRPNSAVSASLPKVRKAIIPAAGFGTRFLPVTKAVPKELLPVSGRPVIDFVVDEAIDAGVSDILIVLSRGKEAIQRYFDRAPELELRLESAGKHKELDLVRSPGRGANIYYVYQEYATGLGDAVARGRTFAGEDPFLVLLGDTILQPTAALDLVSAYQQTGGNCVAVEKVSLNMVSKYGIVKPGEIIPSEGVFPVAGLVEKPAPEATPSRYAIAARYLFTAHIWTALDGLCTGQGGELQLTDAMDKVARFQAGLSDHTIDERHHDNETMPKTSDSPMYAVPIRGKRFDLGDPVGMLGATIELNRQREPVNDTND